MDEHKEYDVCSETQSVALQGADAVRANIEQGLGLLQVAGGAQESLLNAAFTYNVPEWRPDVVYEVQEGQGTLSVSQPEFRIAPKFKDLKYEWGLRFNHIVPLDLNIRVGDGAAVLEFVEMALTHLDAKVASGRLDAVLESLAALQSVALTTASGKINLVTSGVYEALESIALTSASGALDLNLAGKYAALKTVTAKVISGHINFVLAQSEAPLETLSVDAVSGAVYLDLRGRVQSDLKVRVRNVSGKVHVLLPEDVGVSAQVKKVSGTVKAPNLKREGARYVNAAYGHSERVIHLDMTTVSGGVKLQLGEGEVRNKDIE